MRGVPPEPSQGCHSEAQWCPRMPRCVFSSILKRRWNPFGESFLKMLHFFSILFRSVFSEASRHALVTISASFWEAFLKHFRYVFGNQRNLDFHDPSYAKAMFQRFWTHPFLYFSVVFSTLRFWQAILCDFLAILDALRAPFRHLWGHITAVFLLPIFSRFLRCVFITFRLPRGNPNGRRRPGRRPSGTVVKHHLVLK